MQLNKKVKVRVPATSGNLGPGFDCLGLALAFYNELELIVQSGKPHLSIEIIGEGSDKLPRDYSNIIVTAIFEVLGRSLGQHRNFVMPRYRLSLKLVNRIPLARGLGSSAAARVAGLVAANHICGDSLTKEELLNIGAKLEGHPDNMAPALFGNICLSGATNDSGKFWSYTVCRLPKNLKAVVCVPAFELSTLKARQVLPKKYEREDAVFNISRATLLVNSLLSKQYELLRIAMDDRLHQSYRAELVPGLRAVCLAAQRAGAYNAVLSGAGPTVLAITDSKMDVPEKTGKAMVKEFAKNKVKSRYLVLNSDSKGAAIFK